MLTSPDNSLITGADEEPEIENYRELSWGAIASLLLGLASAAVLIHPVLAILPIVAVVVAAFALRSIRNSEQRLTGEWAAIFGLALAVFFLGVSFSWHYVRLERLKIKAQEFADDWLTLVKQKRLGEADQLRVRSVERGGKDVPTRSASPPGQHDEGQVRPHEVFGSQPVSEYLKMGDAAQSHFERFTATSHGPKSDKFVLEYTFFDQSQPTRKKRMYITVERTFSHLTRQTDWIIRNVSLNNSGV